MVLGPATLTHIFCAARPPQASGTTASSTHSGNLPPTTARTKSSRAASHPSGRDTYPPPLPASPRCSPSRQTRLWAILCSAFPSTVNLIEAATLSDRLSCGAAHMRMHAPRLSLRAQKLTDRRASFGTALPGVRSFARPSDASSECVRCRSAAASARVCLTACAAHCVDRTNRSGPLTCGREMRLPLDCVGCTDLIGIAVPKRPSSARDFDRLRALP